MQKNDLIKTKETILRILEIKDDKAFIIDCKKRNIPKWTEINCIENNHIISEIELQKYTATQIPDIETLDAKSKSIMNERYTIISTILPYVSDFKMRNKIINNIILENNISRQSIINYLCLFLSFQNKVVLAPKSYIFKKTLDYNEKNFRWALNKYFYNQNKNSLKTAYTIMLKEKYCSKEGLLNPQYPTFNQFRYFYRKNKNMQTYYISRSGIKKYQRNHRPLLGDNVQEFAKSVGIGMIDSTICDVYLINDSGNLIGRPILTACVDAYSNFCCGYNLTWEGGMYSLRGLMLNIIEDKVEHCKKHGIIIEKSQWDCNMLPATLVTDMGTEYTSGNFEQIVELGIKVINLPSFRPELKGSIEKFFDLIQGLYKPYLKGKGLIEKDYSERGSHDYRKDACLTMCDFEKIIIHCIIYYNSQKILKNYPYTELMISANIQPYANAIWEFGKNQDGANLIFVKKENLILTLLPRTKGEFSRKGLKVNKLRYKNEKYIENYLVGGNVTVAYNPDDVSYVWLCEKGEFIQFELIEKRFKNKNLEEVKSMEEKQKEIIKIADKSDNQAKINLASHILAIANATQKRENVSIKKIRETRQKEKEKTHIDYMKK